MPPALHPLIVHFPFALLTLSVLAQWAGLWRRNPGLSTFAWWTQVWGTIGLALAVGTGLLAKSTVKIPEAALALISTHEQLAFLSASAFAILFFWRIPSSPGLPKGYELLFLVVFTVAVGVMLAGAWFGGEMVYRFGVGVSRTGLQ